MAIKSARRRSPKGGCEVNGKRYRGGQFLPAVGEITRLAAAASTESTTIPLGPVDTRRLLKRGNGQAKGSPAYREYEVWRVVGKGWEDPAVHGQRYSTARECVTAIEQRLLVAKGATKERKVKATTRRPRRPVVNQATLNGIGRSGGFSIGMAV